MNQNELNQDSSTELSFRERDDLLYNFLIKCRIQNKKSLRRFAKRHNWDNKATEKVLNHFLFLMDTFDRVKK